MKVKSRVDMVLMRMLEHLPWKIRHKWCFLSNVFFHPYSCLPFPIWHLGISVSSCDFATQIQMMVSDDKTYLHSELIAVAF